MQKKDLRQIWHPRPGEPIRLKCGTRIPELLCYQFMKTEPSRDPQLRAISTGSDLGRPP